MNSTLSWRSILVSCSTCVLIAATASLAGSGSAGAATPSPSPSCSSTPNGFFVTASTHRVESGQSVTLTITYQQCGGGPEHHFTISARPLGQSSPITTIGQVTTPAGEYTSASLTTTPDHSTTYLVTEDGQVYSQPPSQDVTVDRTGGSCAGVVTLTAPSAVHLDQDVLLTGQRTDTSTVTVKIRQRARTTYAALPTSAPDGNGRFAAQYRADDDYAVYAAGDRCDSPAVVVPIRTTITGPATARRGSSVALTVTGLPGAPVAVYFHKAGTTGFVRRRATSLSKTGTYTTSYLATSDYRYYAVVGNDHRVSNGGLTQVR